MHTLFIFQLILANVLNGLYESVSQILRRNVEKRALLENLDAVILAMDEICDGGFVSLHHCSKYQYSQADIP